MADMVLYMSHKTASSSTKQAVGARDAADRLGVHQNTLDRLRKAGSFPGAFKVVRDWKYPVKDLDDFMASRRAVLPAR